MRIGFIDDNKNVYSFSLRKTENNESLLTIVKTETLIYSVTGGTRVISDGQVDWGSADQWVAPEARQFIERVLKLKAFL